ncbi:MAG TPA: HEAT repeat domain-containing protein [Candidatus Brocadiia bacterium]|nr:HEAT repeat domain-containing protein [Candidatus Brocadiia bacterium]
MNRIEVTSSAITALSSFLLYGSSYLLITISVLFAQEANHPIPSDPAALQKEIKENAEALGGDPYKAMESARRLAEIGKPAIQACLDATRSGNPQSRWWAASALGRIHDPLGRKRLLELLSDDPHPLVRSVAAWHIQSFIADEDVVQGLQKALNDSAPEVRGWVLRVLRERRVTRALPEIEKLLKHPHPPTRYDALYAAVALRGTDRMQLIRDVLRADESADVRDGALRCLTVIEPPDPEGCEILIEGLADKDAEVRKTAHKLLLRGYDQSFGFDPDGKAEEREAAIARWKKWHQENKRRLVWNAEKKRFEASGSGK